MKLRTLFITVVVLAALSALVYVVQRPAPPPSADPRLGQAFLDRALVEKAQKLRLRDGGKTLTLVHSAGAWQVADYFHLPVDFDKLSRFVGDLADTKLQRLVTTSPERLARLEFKDTKIELLDAADRPLWAVTLGKTPDAGGRIVRFGDEPRAYLANLNTWLDLEPKNWADPQLVNVKAEDVARIELPLADGPLVLSREKKDAPWTADRTPARQQLKPDKIASVLGALGNIRFSDTTMPADPKVAAAKPHRRTFKLTTFGRKTYTIDFARQPEVKKLKPPAPSTDGRSGPAALGSVQDVAHAKAQPADAAHPPGEKKPLEPEFETIPAGPVFVHVASSDPAAPINAFMQQRAFEVSDYAYTGLPAKSAELFEPAPATAPAAPAAGTKK